MNAVYLICAVVGGTLIVCQFLLGLFGMGHHDAGGDAGCHDAGADAGAHDAGGHDSVHDTHDSQSHENAATWFLSLLTFRTVVAGLAFFGLAGLAAGETLSPLATFGIAAGAGASALVAVGYVMRSLSRLNVDGTARIERSVGSTGTVYLSIPGRKAGVGKVHISLQNRTVECKAVTARDDLPTGAKVVVVGVIGTDVVEVSLVTSIERANHV